MTTSKIQVTEGSGKNLATNSVSEDAVTKELQRVVLNDSVGNDATPLIGSATETAPVSDTASSGLNGRLQRIAQRLSTLLNGGLPAALAAGGGLKVEGVAGGVAQPVSEADGSNVTIGAKTDAKSTATDATSISIMQVLKQISASIQLFVFGAGTAAAAQRTTLASDDPAVATLGATTGAAVITDANGTLQQYLRGLIKQWIAGTLTFASQGYAARVSVTRPSDTTTYAAGDVVGVTGGGTACIQFSNMGAGAGEYMITSARFQRNATALISGETSYTLHLFNVTQPAAQVDNAVFDVAAGDQASYLGSINLGTPVDLGSTLAIEQNGINKQVTLASANLFGVLVTVGGYTPVSAAVHVVELHAVKM